MEQISEILFISITMPMIPMLFIIRDKRSRLLLGYLIIGAVICLMAGAFNSVLLGLFNGDSIYVTTTITPISEEILKALPVLYFAIFFASDQETLLSISFALGVGFAILEDAVILAQNISSIDIGWAFARVIGAALMHGACTSMIGLGMSYIHKRRKLFFCGTFALLTAAILFHATFNVLVQSSYRIVAFILPAALYIPVVVKQIRSRKVKK